MTTPLPDYSGLASLAFDATAMTPAELAEAAAVCQDTIAALRLLEAAFTDSLGKTAGKHTANLPDGRQYEVKRATDRREWDREDWERDVRRKVVDGLPDLVLVDPATGEEFDRSLGFVVSEAVAASQQVHGSAPPRSRDLRSLGLYASDYCITSPAGWRLTTVRLDPDAGVNGGQATTFPAGGADAAPDEPKGTPDAAASAPAPASIPTQREAS